MIILYRATNKLFLSILLTLYSVICMAHSGEVIPVTNKNISLNVTTQKDSATDLIIWNAESGGKGSSADMPQPIADYNFFGTMAWACTSNSASTVGKCPNFVGAIYGVPITSISLVFTEQHTGINKILTLDGFNEKVDYSGHNLLSQTYGINSSAGNYKLVAQSLLTVRLSKRQIESLPIGGEWHAKLMLHQWASYPNRNKLVTWTADITINLIDSKNIQVYLPNYSTASPSVDLDLKRKPSPDRSPILAGDVKIDACLYDGYNAQSKKYDITFSAPSSKGENFYITNTIMNPNPKLSNTIPYQVWVSTPAAPSVASQKVLPNTLFSFTGVNKSSPKLVTLSNIPNPVYCTPWLINLKTANISQNTQAPGHYQGSLQLKFTPSSSSL